MALSLVPRTTQQQEGPVVSRAQDIKLVAWVAPDAPLGTIEVQLGLGKGSGGRGRQSIMDDPHRYTDALRRVANHILAYAADYDSAARGEEPPGLATDGTIDGIPVGPLPYITLIRPCLECGTLSPWPYCSECMPL